jgi:hypothetical protein
LAIVPNPAAQPAGATTAMRPTPDEGAHGRPLTKPLWRAPTPSTAEAYQALPPPAVPPEPAGPVTRKCPGCGKPLHAEWIFCPHCEEPVRAPFVGGIAGRVGRDTRRTGIFMIILMVLGGIGIAWALVGTSIVLLDEQYPGPFFGVLAGVIVLAGISALITLARGGGDTRAEGVRRIVLGTLKLAGILIFVGGLLMLAGFIFILAVCYFNPPRW